MEALIEDQIPFVFGVVPNVCLGDWRNPEPQSYAELGSEKCQLLQQAVSGAPVDIALHGLTHQQSKANTPSEFAGISAEAQVRKIFDGARMLEASTGHRPFAFVPPWNSYDQNTIAALLANGFAVLSAGPRSEAPEAEARSSLSVFPQTVSLGNFAPALESAKKTSCRELSIIVEMHEYDFTDVSSTKGAMNLTAFRQQVSELRSDAQVELRNFSQALAHRNRWSRDDFFFPRKSLLSRVWSFKRLVPAIGLVAVVCACLLAICRRGSPED